MTDEELIAKYSRYCGYWAKYFMQRENPNHDVERGSVADRYCDVEDLASDAMLKLIKCPAEHRHEHAYVTKLIIRAIIDGLRKKRSILAREWQPPHHVGSSGGGQFESQTVTDYFDALPGPDGLAGKTQFKFDLAKAQAYLEYLPLAERLVVELHFGLTGLRPASERQIGKKLGRTEFWVQRRLSSGLTQLRKSMGVLCGA